MAFASFLRGHIAAANAAFEEARAIQNRNRSHELCGLAGILRAEHLIRTGKTRLARKLTTHNREICEGERWHQDVSRCDWILGWLDTIAGRWAFAHNHLDQAEATFTRGHMIQELARVHLTRAACHLDEGNPDAAIAASERALDLAAPRNYRLIHSDALVLRARIALAQNDAITARNDAESALQIAEQSEYAWAERDACEVLADAWNVLANRAESARYAERAHELNRRLTPAD